MLRSWPSLAHHHTSLSSLSFHKVLSVAAALLPACLGSAPAGLNCYFTVMSQLSCPALGRWEVISGQVWDESWGCKYFQRNVQDDASCAQDDQSAPGNYQESDCEVWRPQGKASFSLCLRWWPGALKVGLSSSSQNINTKKYWTVVLHIWTNSLHSCFCSFMEWNLTKTKQ